MVGRAQDEAMSSQASSPNPTGLLAGLRARLTTAPDWAFALWGGLFAFSVYFAMYAFRKPFSAATYDMVEGWTYGLDFKATIAAAQILGYALSKFLGVKIVSEMTAARRGAAIIILIALSEVALIGFAMAPAPLKVPMLFLNGLPLGMIWGLVFSYLEGRRLTDLLGAMLCASFIVSSGAVKSVGQILMNGYGVPEFWMPAVTGLLFFPVLVISVIMLSALPAPNAQDIAERVERKPMDGAQRRALLAAFGPGILLLVTAYVLLTVFRDFRDKFAADFWADLGILDAAGRLTASELPAAVVVLVIIGAMIFIKNNWRALNLNFAMVLGGFGFLGLSTFAFHQGWISPFMWMMTSGIGLYAGYVPFNCILFDRLIAASRMQANAGFLIYVADASGYAGTVALLLVRSVYTPEMNWPEVFIWLSYITAGVGVVFMIGADRYFRAKAKRHEGEAALNGVAAE
ncbi:DUF5690 family protein [Woodsholea maritima]|uniref:DUF5690 family protein n=1 Tax=Woodsholea maritima TaxID=240237 RepID=UPI000377B54D|nr:DUF5690 family protein [Woodsholea maritima]